jgi:hypothetical protein
MILIFGIAAYCHTAWHCMRLASRLAVLNGYFTERQTLLIKAPFFCSALLVAVSALTQPKLARLLYSDVFSPIQLPSWCGQFCAGLLLCALLPLLSAIVLRLIKGKLPPLPVLMLIAVPVFWSLVENREYCLFFFVFIPGLYHGCQQLALSLSARRERFNRTREGAAENLGIMDRLIESPWFRYYGFLVGAAVFATYGIVGLLEQQFGVSMAQGAWAVVLAIHFHHYIVAPICERRIAPGPHPEPV